MGAAVLGFGLVRARREQSSAEEEATRGWVAAIAAAVVALALSHCGDDPTRPWWALGAILATSVLVGLLGLWQRRAGEVFASALLLNVAAIASWWAQDAPTAASLAAWNVVAFAAATIVWSLVERLYRPGLPTVAGFEALPQPHLTSQAGQILLAVYAGALLVCQAFRIADAPVDRLAVLGLLATAAAALVLLWDHRARFPLASLYATGLSGLVLLVTAQDLKPRELLWTASLALAGFTLLVALVAWALPRGQSVWRALRIPAREETWSTGWFAAAQAVLMALATALGVWISLDGGFQLVANPALPWLVGRLVAPLALALLLPASVLTLPWAHGQLRRDWHTGVLVLGLLLLCVAGWAWLDLGTEAPWLHPSVILLVAASIMSLVAAVAMPRWLPAESAWTAAARRATSGFGGCAVLALVAVLVQEVAFYGPEGTPMAGPAVAVVALALLGLVAGAITLAVVGRLDPLRLSDRGRTAYVYAAEVLLGLVAVHLRLTMPEWFQGGLVLKYWLFVVLGLAFAGAALSEFFQRRGLPVLSEPLGRTATLAPIAPAIGFWFFLGHGFVVAHPSFWLWAAAFYGVLARLRRSIAYGLLASLVLCVGLCVFWIQGEWEHPLLSLIPFALVLLVAEHLNHEYLSERQSTALRYLALSMIYFSSSFEYVQTLGESPWMPIVLILLALAGVAAGLVLQIRSFLYMGTVFLSVVVVTMIKYAAFDRHQSWILPTFCIVLGTGLIPAFALFKKRREAILAAVERFRSWKS